MRLLDELLAVAKEEDRRRVGKTIPSNPKSGQGWTALALRRLKTSVGGKCFYKVICGAPTTMQSRGIVWTRLDIHIAFVHARWNSRYW